MNGLKMNFILIQFLFTLLIIEGAYSENVTGVTATEEPSSLEENSTRIKNPLSMCDDWTRLGLKCYKVIDTLARKGLAEALCQKLDSSSYLVEIRSEKEQISVFNLVKSYYSKRSPVNGKGFKSSMFNFWLGTNVTCTNCEDPSLEYQYQYVWESDEQALSQGFTNWDENSPEYEGQCVQMSMDTGKWSDVGCRQKNLVVCEKETKINAVNLYDAFESLLGELDEVKSKQDKFEREPPKIEINYVVPIGFIYTQFPNQSSPLDIWPGTQWTDITDEYSGLFFRAEGKASKPFGQIQQQNYSRISHITAYGIEMNDLDTPNYDKKYVLYEFQARQGDWTLVIAPNKQLHGISFFQTDSDNTPINTAIRIWKRTG